MSCTRGAMPPWSCLGGITLTTALFDFIGTNLKDVPGRLGDAHLVQLRPFAGKCTRPAIPKTAENFDGEVLGCGDYGLERFNIRVQVPVVKRAEHLARDELIEHPRAHGSPRGLAARSDGGPP